MMDEINGQIVDTSTTQTAAQETPEQTWEPGTEEQLPAELAQAQAIQKEIEQQKDIQPEPTNFVPIPVRKKSPQDSFAELKARALKAERERDEALSRLQATNQAEQEDLSISLAPDELAEGKHLTKVQKQMARLQQQVKEAERRAQEMALEVKLKQQYPDFDEVVTAENLQRLQEYDPESALIVESIPNIYSKAVAAHRMVTQMNKKLQEQQSLEMEKAKAKLNSNKPRPAVSINPQTAENPMARVNAFAQGLTPELEKQLLKEMYEARNNY